MAAVVVALVVPAAAARAHHDPVPEGRPFEVPVSSPELYDVAPATHQHTLVVPEDGAKLFLETWLPAARPGGPALPDRMPTILVITPYVQQGTLESRATRDAMVRPGVRLQPAPRARHRHVDRLHPDVQPTGG